MVAESTQTEVSELTQREIECGHRLAAAMFAMGKQQASIGARMSKMGGFDRSAFVLIKTLAHQGPLRSSALATAVHSDPSTVSRQVAALVRDGLVERRADQGDGRASVLAVTQAGIDLMQEFRSRMGLSLAQVVKGWAPEDVEHFIQLFERFVADHEAYLPTLINECVQWARSEGEKTDV
jgi:DNA-binding MarR family transcriptional regulator